MKPEPPKEPIPADAFRKESASTPIIVSGDEQGRVDMALPDGGLKPVVGVQNVQVFRACHSRPELADGEGYTYAHQHDIAVWRGRLYAVWAMTPRDEDVPPYKTLYATSADGFHWSAPAELFPREISWPNRFYFFRASNDRMLAFARSSGKANAKSEQENSMWWGNGILLVREILADHRLGEIFTLLQAEEGLPPCFEQATDEGFVAACLEASANGPLLEQQDYGTYLGDGRMKWHTNPPKLKGFLPFGKALCFYHRKDGLLVGLSKMGFATLSQDEGKSWSEPVLPPTLIAGTAKVWGQRTADGRFALAYNPDRRKRYPLVLVHGEDGREFRDMRVVHGELPPMRYPGLYKEAGPQYVRGLAEWADDGTLADHQAIWLIYSVNKEDIWVARVPLPIKPDETAFPAGDFENVAPGHWMPGWNFYSPRWAQVSVVSDGDKHHLELRDGDPFDYAQAVRVFPVAPAMRVELPLSAAQLGARLEIELCDGAGRRPIRLALTEDGSLQAADGGNMVCVGMYQANVGVTIALTTDLARGRYAVQVDGGELKNLVTAEEGVRSVERLVLRTGAWRGSSVGAEVDAKSDVPLATPAVFRVHDPVIRLAR